MEQNFLEKAAENLGKLKPTATCETCGATAYSGAELEHEPRCLKDRENWMRRVISFSQLPANKPRTFDGFKKIDGTAKALAAAKLYCDPAQRRHPFLTFIGPPGVGKTHLAQAIGWWWAESLKFNFRYVQAEKMLDQLRRCFDRRSDSPEDDFDTQLNFLCKVPLLILDDLGTESSSDWSRAKLQSVIDDRYENGRLTVVTTNDPAKIPSRVLSRLREGVIVAIDAQDYRLTIASERSV
ncbi:ATP-binding protein [Dehalogenimonas etheniformans]|uniref:ATP-binding protein n=1 Tax=Dehalogenimonas etheniformans TaxID=1536648 RepID=A0A2P5P503_9CHLR|nr:ATP-binding protein [Dehalogenimonas etheniformans]PPD57365.1 ATP-binding protein [Dehalogenimonas etheniformans]QNT75215.1 ATP-binding protein [Dehalogenimonas etheniformans]